MAPLFFGNPAVRAVVLIRGFASQPHDWFAFVGRVRAIPWAIPGPRPNMSLNGHLRPTTGPCGWLISVRRCRIVDLLPGADR